MPADIPHDITITITVKVLHTPFLIEAGQRRLEPFHWTVALQLPQHFLQQLLAAAALRRAEASDRVCILRVLRGAPQLAILLCRLQKRQLFDRLLLASIHGHSFADAEGPFDDSTAQNDWLKRGCDLFATVQALPFQGTGSRKQSASGPLLFWPVPDYRAGVVIHRIQKAQLIQ
eukprot:2519373-Rhodomonas_salina.3